MRDFSATILRNGSVRSVSFELFCRAEVAALCTPELKRRILTAITSRKYIPGKINGKTVKMRVHQNRHPGCEYDAAPLAQSH